MMNANVVGERPNFEPIEGEVELAPAEQYASNLIEWAIERHCSDLFVSDTEACVTVSVRRMGRIERVRRLTRSYGHRLQGHLRVLTGADAGESMRPTEGRGVMITPDGSQVDMRLSSLPTMFGQDIAIRLFDPIRGARPLDSLGLDESELIGVQQLLDRPDGLLLVAGPTGSGKSSTMYAAIGHLNDGSKKIHTLEDPIEHAVPGVMQSQVNLKADLDFPELLATILRHSPDVIMIGEIRDAKTAEAAVRAGATGHLVLATVHAKTAGEAVDVMLQYGVNHKFLAGSLSGVINQRLLRQLCTECRKPIDQPTVDLTPRLEELCGDEDLEMYQAVGCDVCHQDGYESLVCLPEVMPIDQKLSAAIAAGKTGSELESIAVGNGMLRMPEKALMRVARGQTSMNEIHRIVDPAVLRAVQSPTGPEATGGSTSSGGGAAASANGADAKGPQANRSRDTEIEYL